MDVRGERYETLAQLLVYCHRVAGVVGLMMARIMGVTDTPTLARAADLGLAFQLTNIARDIVDDARAGRVYVPQDWIVEEGLSPEDLGDPAHAEAVARLRRRLVLAAEPYYASARRYRQAAAPLCPGHRRGAWHLPPHRTETRGGCLDAVQPSRFNHARGKAGRVRPCRYDRGLAPPAARRAACSAFTVPAARSSSLSLSTGGA